MYSLSVITSFLDQSHVSTTRQGHSSILYSNSNRFWKILECSRSSLQSSAFNPQLSAFSLQPSACSLHLAVFSFQTLSFSLQLYTSIFQPSASNSQPLVEVLKSGTRSGTNRSSHTDRNTQPDTLRLLPQPCHNFLYCLNFLAIRSLDKEQKLT